jgi:exosome complex component RRP45
VLLDATREEAAAAVGSVVVVRDRFSVTTGELCAVHKSEGVGMSASQLHRCIRLAAARTEELGDVLRAALKVHEKARVLQRVRRVAVGPAGVGSSMAGAAAEVEAARRAVAPRAAAVVTAEQGGAALVAEEAPAVTPQLRTLALSEEGAGGGSAPVEQASGGAGVVGAAATNGAGTLDTAPLCSRCVQVPSEAPGPSQAGQGAAKQEGKTGPSRGRKRRSLKRDGGISGYAPVDTAPGYDEFESIAAMIAGPVTPGVEPMLEGSVKKQKGKKKARQ